MLKANLNHPCYMPTEQAVREKMEAEALIDLRLKVGAAIQVRQEFLEDAELLVKKAVRELRKRGWKATKKPNRKTEAGRYEFYHPESAKAAKVSAKADQHRLRMVINTYTCVCVLDSEFKVIEYHLEFIDEVAPDIVEVFKLNFSDSAPRV